MTNYLFFTNTNNYKIDNSIIHEVNNIFQHEIKTKFCFITLQHQKAYEWSFKKPKITCHFKKLIKNKFKNIPVDINLLKINPPRKKSLLIADMDSTIIQEESLNELAKFSDFNDQVSLITKKAMEGKINFEKALIQRVKLLENLPLKKIQALNNKINFTSGSQELLFCMNHFNAITVLISGGFMPTIKHVANKLEIKFFHGNEFIYKNNFNGEKVLSGLVKKPILNQESKLNILLKYKKKLKLSSDEIICVGDGANDIKMIKEAGTGVSFNGKKILEESSDATFNYTNLTGLLFLQGYKKSEFEKLNR